MIDEKFQTALSKIKNLDVRIEDIHNLFCLISKMGFDELSATQNTVGLLLNVSVNVDESVRKVLEHFSEAISDRATALYYGCKLFPSEEVEKRKKIARVFRIRGSLK